MPKPAVAETPLARQLAGARRRPQPVDAFRLARRAFVAGERVDMQGMAARLGVTRATLFRWVGNRNQLLTEVIWSLGEELIRSAVHAVDATGARGPARIAGIARAFIQATIEAPFFRTYLAREPEAALRLLTTRASPVQLRTVAAIEGLLAEEVAAGTLESALPLRDLAYVITRISEAFIYNDLITGAPPDADKAAAAIEALLRS